MNRKVFLSVILGLLVLAACGPVYKTNYDYKPPQTDNGRMCVNQCLNTKSACEQDCHARQVDCEYRADEDAQIQYDNYVRTQRFQHQEIKKTVTDFHRYCDEETVCAARCVANHNLCYNNCGGVVNGTTICTSGCEK